MPADSSNRQLVEDWRNGDDNAFHLLVRRYMDRLIALARSRLSRQLSRRLDPEDVVMSAWRSFYVALDQDRIQVPADDRLWPILATLTMRKLSRNVARQTAQRRDVNSERPIHERTPWSTLMAQQPSPQATTILTETVQALLESLDATQRKIFERTMQGETQSQIAALLQCSERTVRRHLEQIKIRLREQLDEFPADSSFQEISNQLAEAFHKPDISMTRNDQTPLAVPYIHLDQLLLEKFLGQGRFGKVYRATLVETSEPVAVKFLKKRFWRNPQVTSRLLREAELVYRLSSTHQKNHTHQNDHIVKLLGSGTTTYGAAYLVMEFIDGQDLHAWRHTSDIDVSEIVGCGISVASGLQATHDAGIIHADVTPTNVLRSHAGEFRLTDFGFATALAEINRSDLGGTPGFMAPEQISDAFGPLSPATDVYGVGGLLYLLITGRPPISGENRYEIFAKTLAPQPIPARTNLVARSIPSRLVELIERCLHKDPASRPQSIDIVLNELQMCQTSPT